MIHVFLHFLVPWLIATGFYREHWLRVTAVLWATMLVDLDHLLADPIYDPERCSIGFHPLHTAPAIGLYAALFALPWFADRAIKPGRERKALRTLHLVGLGLLVHMGLDGIDCL